MTCRPPMSPKRQKIQYYTIDHVLHLSQQGAMITNHNESSIRLKAGNKYSKHVSIWSKELRNFRLKLQDRED